MKYLLLFLIVFDPQIPYFINGLGFTAIVFLVLFAALAIKNKGRIPKSLTLTHAKPFAAFLILNLLFSFFSLLATGGNSDFLLGVAKSIVVFCAVVSYLLVYNIDFSENFFSGLLFIYCLNAVINFVAGTFPEYFHWAEVYRGLVISDALGDNPYRNSFISGSGFFSIGTAYGLFCLLYIYFISSNRNGLFASVGLLLSSVAGFVAARTSMFAIGAGAIYLLKEFQLKKIFVLMILVALFSRFALDENGILGPYKEWLLGFFDLKEDTSAAHLLDEMYFWPGVMIFFFGSGSANNGLFPYTDSGFMQDILSGGVFYMLLNICFPTFFVLKFFKNEPVFSLLFLGVAVLFQMKGSFFISNAQGMAIFYIMYFFFAFKYSKRLESSRVKLH
jgi:hypothetical protein